MSASLAFHLIKEHPTVQALDLVLDRSGKNPISWGLSIKKQVLPNFSSNFTFHCNLELTILLQFWITHKLALPRNYWLKQNYDCKEFRLLGQIKF